MLRLQPITASVVRKGNFAVGCLIRGQAIREGVVEMKHLIACKDQDLRKNCAAYESIRAIGDDPSGLCRRGH